MRHRVLAMPPQVLGVTRNWREERRTTIFKKMTSLYKEYRTKHRMLADFLSQDDKFQSLRDRLKQKYDELTKKDEEIRERDDELMRAINWCNELKAALKDKEDALEVSKGVVAESTDLQMQVASLMAKLRQREARTTDLRGELSARVEELGRAKKDRMVEVATLDNACRSERANEMETSTLKVAILEEKIQGLEADLSGPMLRLNLTCTNL